MHARTAVSVSPDANVAFLDYDRVPGAVRVRGRMPGDRFRPLGMREAKKLKEFFIDNKVPFWERDRVPLLTSEGAILWVVGHRISDEVKVNSETTRVLQIEVSTENE